MSAALQDMTARKFYGQLLRYGLVGIASNSASYAAYLTATFFGATPKITASVLYVVGVGIGFWANRRWTFRHKGGTLGSAARYLGAHCVGYVINMALLLLLVDDLGYPHQVVQAIAIVVVAMFLFVACRRFVFADRDLSIPWRQ